MPSEVSGAGKTGHRANPDLRWLDYRRAGSIERSRNQRIEPPNRHSDGSLLDQVAGLVASFDELRSAYRQLQADHDGIRDERDNIRDTLEKATNELTSIRAAIGSIAPDDVASLASERESLGAELRILRNKYEALLTDLSDRQGSIGRLEERVHELAPFQGERDALAEQVKAREFELDAVRANRDALTTNLSRERAANVEAHSELGHLRQQLTQSENSANTRRKDVRSSKASLPSKKELCSVQTVLARLSDEQQKTLVAVQGLMNTVAERDNTIAFQRDRFEAELEAQPRVARVCRAKSRRRR